MSKDHKLEFCRVCGFSTSHLMHGKVLTHKINYFECVNCSYVQTEEPYWLHESYSDAINSCDTGIMNRNIANARIVLGTMGLLRQFEGSVVDWAGGYGILVRLVRDSGIEALWTDRYCTNLLAKGFEYTAGRASMVTAFEALEHFINPIEELEQMFRVAPSVLISTSIIPHPAPAQSDWWYYGADHGQHIGFFRMETLRYIAKHFKKRLISNGKSLHLLTDEPMNEYYWRSMVRLNRLVPLILYKRLNSKTWQDFLLMSSKK